MAVRRAGALALGLTLFATTATAVSQAPVEPVAQREFRAFTPQTAAADLAAAEPPSSTGTLQPPIADFPTGPYDPELAPNLPDPQPGPRDALVRVAACGICGTDVSYVHLGLVPEIGRAHV